MSHFTVAVIGKGLDEEAIDEALAPFHEFECTGRVDEYVQSIDITEEAISAYEQATSRVIVFADGSMKSVYEDGAFLYRDPTEEELEDIQKAQKDFSHKVGFSYQNTGKGYQIKYLAEGAEERDVATKEVESFEEFVGGYFGVSGEPIKEGDEPDLHGDHKYGYIVHMNDGTYQVFDRTNPNRKWDWYSIGGRWSGSLKAKPGATSGVLGRKSWTNGEDEIPANYFDILTKSEIDLTGMTTDRVGGRLEAWEKTCDKYRTKFDAPGRNLTNEKIDEIRYAQVTERERLFAEWQALDANDPAKKPFWDYVKDAKGQEFVDSVSMFAGWFCEIQGSDSYASIQDWIADVSPINTYAVLKDGEWYSKGEMGWFGMSDEKVTEEQWASKMRDLVDSLDDDDMIAVVDCHI